MGTEAVKWWEVPGVYRDLKESEYRGPDTGLSRSVLEDYHSGASLREIREGLLHPDAPTEDMVLGSAVHAGLLNPQADLVVEAPVADGRTKEGKAAKAAFAAASVGKLVLAGELDGVPRSECYKRMVAAVQEDEWAGPLVSHTAERELTVVFRHPQAALPAHGRLDGLLAAGPDSDSILFDLKMIYSLTPEVRERRVRESGIHRQLAFYRAGLMANGRDVDHCVVVWVCNRSPWEVLVQRLPGAHLDLGWEEIEAAWLRMDPWVAAGEWPTRAKEAGGIVEDGLSEWYVQRHIAQRAVRL